MNEHELEQFEAELRQLRPAPAPERFVNRLRQAVRESSPATVRVRVVDSGPSAPVWQPWLRWLLPVGSAAGILAVLLLTRNTPAPAPADTAIKAEPQVIDEVELDQQLVAAFEGVAQVPGMPPLRFRCYGWQEDLTLRDASGALEVEQRRPRLEVVPVGFDVY